MMNKIARLAVSGFALAIAGMSTAHAEYPERPVTVVVPFSAGGNTDVIGRIVVDHLTEKLGSPVVVENRGGGGGTVGSAMVAGAEPDGYTLLFATAGTHSVNPNLRSVKYDPVKDFEPVSVAVVSSVLIVVNPSVEATNLEEFIALTSSGDAKLNFASGGVGTVAHVAGELYNQLTGSSMVHVPYKGAGDALNDVIAGRVHVYMNNLPTFLPHIASGAVRPIALAAGERSSLLPDVATTVEGGLEELQMGSWYGLLAPKGTPKGAIDTLHKAMGSMKESEDVKERMKAIGSEVTVSDSPEAFGRYIEQQLNWWKDVLDNPAFK